MWEYEDGIFLEFSPAVKVPCCLVRYRLSRVGLGEGVGGGPESASSLARSMAGQKM